MRIHIAQYFFKITSFFYIELMKYLYDIGITVLSQYIYCVNHIPQGITVMSQYIYCVNHIPKSITVMSQYIQVPGLELRT